MFGKYMSPSSSTKVNTGLKLWFAVSLLLVIEYMLIYHISPESQGYAVFDAIYVVLRGIVARSHAGKYLPCPKKGTRQNLANAHVKWASLFCVLYNWQGCHGS